MPTLADFARGDLLAAAGITLIIMGLMTLYKKRRKREAATPQITPNEQLERNRQMRGVRGDLETLMVEIEQFAKRLSTHLDAKAMAMELLLKQADDRIAKLQRLKQNGHAVETDDHANLPAREPLTSHEPAAKPITPPQSAPEIPDDPLSRSVYQLADQGLDAQAIARKLDEHVGKIELILALRSA